MRKNGSRLISVKQYRATDLFIFALILAASEILSFYAGKWFPMVATYTFSLLVPLVLTVMMRWGWQGTVFAVVCGLLDCLLSGVATGTQYAVYTIGNAFIALMLIPLKFIGKDRVRSRWWATALVAIGGWLCVYLGRVTVWAVAFAISPVNGLYAWSGFQLFAATDLLSPVMAVAVLLVLRRLDGMFEDQKSYLIRLDNERKEKMRRDTYGDEPVEIDDESLRILNRNNDLYD